VFPKQFDDGKMLKTNRGFEVATTDDVV